MTQSEIIAADPNLNTYQKKVAIERLERAAETRGPVAPAIPPEAAAELRATGTEITAARAALVTFDADTTAQKEHLEKLKLELRRLENPSTLPDDEAVKTYIFTRGKVALLENYFNCQGAALGRRRALVTDLKQKMTRLSARLRQLTGRDKYRYFENPNMIANRPDLAATCAVQEIERVIRGELDEYERLQLTPQRPLIFI
jgi:hypothetical protein